MGERDASTGIGATSTGGGSMSHLGGVTGVGGTSGAGGMTAAGGDSGSGTGTMPSAGGDASADGAASGGCMSVSATTPACITTVGAGSPGLIDNLDDGDGWILPNDGRRGAWFTLNDGTGVQTPEASSSLCILFSPTDGQACTSGSGFSSWGAGIGVVLNWAPECGMGGLYDASAYSGVTFKLSGSVQNGSLRFQAITAETLTVDMGGTCTAASGCGNYYGVDLTPAATTQTFTYNFSDLHQQNWGATVAWNPARIVGLGWEVLCQRNGSGTATYASFTDICVDDVAFF